MSGESRKKSLQKHIVICPHCGKEALDHMTQCPSCKGALTPKGYTPALDPETKKRVRWIVGSILVALAILIFILKRF